MKKINVILALLIISLVSAFAVYNFIPTASAQTSTTTVPVTTVPATTRTVSSDDNVYYYSDYDDLVNQVYNDVYNDVYDQVYQDVLNSLTSDYYQEIYDQVEQKLVDSLSSGDIQVYLDSFQQDIHSVVQDSQSQVFGISTFVGTQEAAEGSGVVYRYDSVTQDYYIITNHHVIEDGDNYRVVFEDGNYVPATVVGYDTEVDIAILRFNLADLHDQSKTETVSVATLGDSDALTQGTVVLAVGNPQGFDFYGSVTMGIVSGTDRQVEQGDYVKYIQHDASINAGNSGGALYDIDGNIIGINVAKFADVNIEGMGFAIPINTVKEVISRIEDGSIAPYNTIVPKLGAQVYDVSALYDNGQVTLSEFENWYDVTITLPAGINTGLIVADRGSGSLAATTIQNGDLIYQINDHVITSVDDYFDYVYSNFQTGDSVTIHYYKYDQGNYSYDEVTEYTTPMTFQ